MLEGLPEPGEGEEIVRVQALCGGNMLEVADHEGESALCLLPAKFRKLVWIKRGNYLIASKSDDDYVTATGAKGRVKYTVIHILFKDQIKHLQQADLWPAGFTQSDEDEEDEAIDKTANELEGMGLEDDDSGDDDAEDGENSDSDEDSLGEMFGGNPNRRRAAMMEDSDSESESESEQEDGDEEASEDENNHVNKGQELQTIKSSSASIDESQESAKPASSSASQESAPAAQVEPGNV